MSTQKNIVIIGGGAVGPLLLKYISQQAKEKAINLSGVTFHLIDPKGFGNGGIAYGECHTNHALNSVAEEMSPFDKTAFKNFSQRKSVSLEKNKFYNRHLYKDFIKAEMVDRPIEYLENCGAHFIEYKKAATIKQNGNKFDVLDINDNIISDDLLCLEAHNIALTVGYGQNTKFQSLKGKDGFLHNPYSYTETSLVDREPLLNDPQKRIAVFGSGPGLYDIANELPQTYRSFYVFSGNGSGLAVRNLSLEVNEKSIPPQALLSLDTNNNCEDAIKALKYEFEGAAQGRSKRRIALDIQKSLKEILLNMNKDVAKQFRQSTYLSPIRHMGTPIPQTSKARLESFDPVFVKAHLCEEDIEVHADGSFEIQVGAEKYSVDVIINATGHGRHNSPIIESLKKQGLAQVSDITNSLETDGSGYRVIPSGLSVIGPATHVGCDGIESFAVYAEKWAKGLIDHICRYNRISNHRDFAQ